MIWHWIAFIVFGFVVGLLARFIHPGRDPGGFLVTAAIGMAGSVIGAVIGRAVGIYTQDTVEGGFVMSVIGAVILLGIWAALARPRRAGYA